MYAETQELNQCPYVYVLTYVCVKEWCGVSVVSLQQTSANAELYRLRKQCTTTDQQVNNGSTERMHKYTLRISGRKSSERTS